MPGFCVRMVLSLALYALCPRAGSAGRDAPQVHPRFARRCAGAAERRWDVAADAPGVHPYRRVTTYWLNIPSKFFSIARFRPCLFGAMTTAKRSGDVNPW